MGKITTINIMAYGTRWTGKTVLRRRFTEDIYYDEYQVDPCDHIHKIIELEGVQYEIKIYKSDVDFPSNNLQLIQRAEGFLLIFVITSRRSFDALAEIRDHIMQQKENANEAQLNFVLVSTQCDVPEQEKQVSQQEAQELAAAFGCTYVETSAKYGWGVKNLFYDLTLEIARGKRTQIPKQNCIIQ